MSPSLRERVGERAPVSRTRAVALLAVSLALGAPLRTLFHLTDVVGSPTLFLVVVALSLVVGTALARVVRPALAVLVGAVLLAGGLGWYIANLATQPAVSALLADLVALVTGRSLLQIENVRLWALSIAPAPVVLTWYFALRRWYVTATAASATTLGFLVLTTDAGLVTALLGVVGGVATIGFGTLDTVAPATSVDERRRVDGPVFGDDVASDDGVDTGRRAVLEQLAAIIVLPAVLARVPSVAGQSLSFAEAGERPTMEGSLLSADESVEVLGSITLSPEVRFTVESPEARYWRVATYDRYTGQGWVRTGNTGEYGGGRLSGPPGDSRTLRQSFEAESDVATVPAAWKPVRYTGDVDVELTTHDGFQPTRSLFAGDRYTVESEVLVATPQQLRAAGDDYPADVRERYTQVPESTPDRVGERTAVLTANAENDYEVALVVERWLQNNKGYSLDVRRPDRNVADRFLFGMDEGYCVYFATTMVTMLRTQGIPSRFVVGYTPGQRVDEDRWVVRGLDSHAWVEVYVPDQGWVQFDPTPSGPRESAEQGRLEDARAAAESGIDTGETNDTEFTETETPTPPPLTETNETATPTESNGTTSTPPGGIQTQAGPVGGAEADDDGGFRIPDLPSREETALGLVALLGVAAGARRSGLVDHVRRELWLRYQRPEDPETDVEVAFQRAMYVLGSRTRRRDPGETVRAYLEAVDADDRIRRLAALRERTRYAGEVDEAVAAEAVELADSVVAER
ncbi:transglutaminase domain-containing protein [Halomicroarcula sp. GCM10025817]|nr:transglutaminase domain-containing protein [Halomicroarcula sp. SYNS111]